MKSISATSRAIQNSISETSDFIRYDDGLAAAELRIGIEMACIITSPIIGLTKNAGKNIIYGIGYAL